KQNQKNIMFTPIERKQIDNILSLGFSDSFRLFHSKGKNYTWWPYAYNARERNLGWRIDYAFVSNKLTKKLKTANIFTKNKGSDHCPIGLEFAD
ncbi:MAG: exodeoxyribonuclease III, partial [bacterium]